MCRGDRQLRRRASWSSSGAGDRSRRRHAGHGRDVLAASAAGARKQGGAPLDTRTPHRATRGGGCRRGSRRRVHAGARCTRAGGVCRLGPATDRSEGHRRRRELPLRTRSRRRPRTAPRARIRRAYRCDARGCFLDQRPQPPAGGRRGVGRTIARAASRARGHSRPRRPARRDARLPDGEPLRAGRLARAGVRHLCRGSHSATAPRSRSA